MGRSEPAPHPPAEEAWALDGPAGRLEARLRPVPEDRSRRGAALLLHPHPLFGGSMMNKVLYRIAKRLPTECGVAALRLNFRGVGESEGEHGGGEGESHDARAALHALAERFPSGPLFGVGYSFGAVFGLRGLLDHDRVEALVALGLPLVPPFDPTPVLQSPLPLHVVQGERDEFGPEEELRRSLRSRSAPTSIEVIADTSHLFPGREDAAVDAVVAYLGRRLDPRPPASPDSAEERE